MSAEQWSGVRTAIEKEWDATIVPCMEEYIKVPNQSPYFDPDWATNGYMEKAMDVLTNWVEKIRPRFKSTIKTELITEPKRTPLYMVEIPASGPSNGKSVMMYGHMDKQPPLDLELWEEGLGPYTPVIRNGRLYGRGGADDGYAVCASLLSVVALEENNIPHGRIVVIIEADEESGSNDLPYYIEKCAERIGDVDLVVCLDSGALNYDQMWYTASLRGYIEGYLKVELNKEGIHSGMGGGVIADSFRVARMLLSRIENTETGEVTLPDLKCEIPASVMNNVSALNDVDLVGTYPLLPGARAELTDNVQLGLNNWWRSTVTVTGCEGIPDVGKGGNVLRQYTTLKLSIRVPPLVNSSTAAAAVKKALEANPPYNAKVSFSYDEAAGDCGNGWAAPPIAPWLQETLTNASNAYFGKPFALCGVGGSIPFMGMLGEKFPQAQFVVTGVLGPNSNAHGPNEFLDIAFSKGINFCVAKTLADHYQQIKA